MAFNQKPSEQVGILGNIDPDANTAATYTTGWVDMDLWDSVMAIIQAGDLGSGATITAKLEQAVTSGGTPKDVTGKAIATITQSGTDQSNTQSIINCRSDEMDAANGYRFVRLSMTVATATSDAAGMLLGFNGRELPATDHDASTVLQVI